MQVSRERGGAFCGPVRLQCLSPRTLAPHTPLLWTRRLTDNSTGSHGVTMVTPASFEPGLKPDRDGGDRWCTLRNSLSGTYTQVRNDFPFVTDPTLANPAKLEQGVPEWALNASVQRGAKDVTVSFFSNYQGEQALGGIEIEDIANITHQVVDEFRSHDASIRWDFKEDYSAISASTT